MQPKVIAIIGDPVEHSRSPAMHNAAFEALGLDYVYVAHRVRPGDLRKAVEAIRVLHYAGLNVTVPHKERIVPLLDSLSPVGSALGAVNTVVSRSGRLHGDNTDAGGFLMALHALRFRPRGRSVIVLGAGGSARAVVWALAEARVGRILVLNRTRTRARALVEILPRPMRAHVETGPLEAAGDSRSVASADLIVNCTSLGLDGRSMPNVALPSTPRHCLVYDLVYGAGPTPLVRSARRHRRQAHDGRSMLLHQAALAFRIWTGRRPLVDVMAKALSARQPGKKLTRPAPLR